MTNDDGMLFGHSDLIEIRHPDFVIFVHG